MKDFTGIDSPYEPPQRPDMTLPTNEMSVSECTQQLVDMLVTRVITLNNDYICVIIIKLIS